jgi:hypothetical protein
VHTTFRSETRSEGGHLEEPGVDGRIILTRIFEKRDGGMYWIYQAQDRDRLLRMRQ